MQRAWLVISTYKGCLEEPELYLKKSDAQNAYEKTKKDDYGDVILAVVALDNNGAECVIEKKHCSESY